MNEEMSRVIPILGTHLGILIVQLAARRLVKPGNCGMFGIYLILLPTGFNCFGWDLTPQFTRKLA